MFSIFKWRAKSEFDGLTKTRSEKSSGGGVLGAVPSAVSSIDNKINDWKINRKVNKRMKENKRMTSTSRSVRR
jgi:hypothetical protein